MSEWKETELIQIGNVVSGGTPSTAIAEYWNGDILFVTPNDLSKNDSAYIEKTERKISKDGLANSSANLLPIGSIVISSRAPIGYFAIAKKELTTNQGCKSVIPKSDFDSLFLYYCFNFFVERIKRLGAGSTFAEISKSDLESVKFPHPINKTTQRKIARILSTADAVIEKTQAAIAKYKAIKQGMLHDLFTRGIDPTTGKLRPTFEDAPELYRESRLGWIPKEWEVERIEKVSSLVTNGFVGVATPYYTTSDKGVPYLFGTNIREDSIDFNDLRYISKDFHSNHIKTQLKSGDMLCVQSGHIGTCAVIPDNFGEANCHALIITRFYKDEIFPDFISFYLNSSIGKHELDKIIIGSTVKHINTSDLANHLVLKPPIEEQKEVSERLKVINHKIQSEQTYLHKLQQIKAGLMADLLSGKKKVNVDEEPVN